MSNIAVSGACGFVGQHLCRSLEADGHTVIGTARDINLGHAFPKVTHLVEGDVRDPAFCRRIVCDYEIDTLYHLAAHSIVRSCALDPINALDVAVLGTARLLEAFRTTPYAKRAIVMTSDKVFGHAPSPYNEGTELDARAPYEVSKACQDLVTRMFRHEYGLNVSVVRAVNIYGPGDPNPSRIVPRTISLLLAGKPPMLNPGARKMMRQYIYIDDMIAALRRVGDVSGPTKLAGAAYCVGSPDAPMSVADVIGHIRATMTEMLGEPCPEPIEADGAHAFSEIESQSVDDALLRSYGWEPKTRFHDGIRRTIKAALEEQ